MPFFMRLIIDTYCYSPYNKLKDHSEVVFLLSLSSLQNFVDMAVNWVSNLSAAEIMAIVVFFVAVSFAIAAAKAVLKTVGLIIAVLAILYLAAPNLYEYARTWIEQFFSAFKRFV